MRKIVLALLVSFLMLPSALKAQLPKPGILSIPGISRAQTAAEGNQPAVRTFGSTGFFDSDFSKLTLNTYCQIGYQANAVNMSVPVNVEFDPIPNEPTAHIAIGTSDIRLKGYNFWVGNVGVNAIINPNLSIFASLGCFLPHSFTEEGRLPFSLGRFGFATQTTFTGTNLECWNAQFGVSLGNWGGGSVLLGSYWQYSSSSYGDMTIFSRPANPTATQDFLLKNWAPFFGLQYMEADLYRAAFIYSPLLTSSGLLATRTTKPISTDLSYNLNQPGYLMSVTGEYFLSTKHPASLSLWFVWALYSMRGRSDVSFVAGGITRTGVVADLTMSQYSLGGGISASLTF